jgi:hypothetical protein
MPQPSPDRGKLDGVEEVVIALAIADGDGSEVFALVDEAFDQIAVAIEERADGHFAFAVRNGFDAGPRAAFSKLIAHRVAAAGAIGGLFLALAAWWWTRIEELSIIWISPSQAADTASNMRA